MFRVGNTPTVVMLPLLFSPSCPDNPAVLVENNITHILSVHDNAEPGFSVSQDTCVYCCFPEECVMQCFHHSRMQDYEYKCIHVSDTPGANM